MPKRGTRYFVGLNNPGPKTGRKYGHAVAAIRARTGRITSFDFEPEFSRRTMTKALMHLYRIGELVRIKKGSSKYAPPIYKPACEQLLSPSGSTTPTNQADKLEPRMNPEQAIAL